jgi:hypothetical protein
MLILAAVLVHLLYDAECCNDQHCRPVPCEGIISEGTGWVWNGITFKKETLRMSPDGECHVCTSPYPLCIYLPART